MEIEELFACLDRHQGSFPKDLTAEVIARREEATPRFLAMLEDIDRNPESWLADNDRMIHIYALYLLALFRETRAYPLIVRIFSRPGEFPRSCRAKSMPRARGSQKTVCAMLR
ncbi:MAG: hypothetical protein DMG97_21175 [Acidobacteria bacterium]|nr:MAG: hypothetical protein DMG97_21175 [Acidobacteriota bacterium]